MCRMEKSTAEKRVVTREAKTWKSHVNATIRRIRSQCGILRLGAPLTLQTDKERSGGVLALARRSQERRIVIMARILPLIGAQIFLAALGCFAQTVSLPEPPSVGAKNHVVSLTLHAVNENGRDGFAFDGKTVA